MTVKVSHLVPSSKREMYLSENKIISYIKHSLVPNIRSNVPLILVQESTPLHGGKFSLKQKESLK
jgi:hypothetical protein